MSNIGGYLNDHIWIIVVIVLVIVALCVAAVVLLYKYVIQRNVSSYSLLEPGLAERMTIDKKLERNRAREAAFLHCTFYMRTSGQYLLVDHLMEIGSRQDKQWFMVRDYRSKTDKLLVLMHRPVQLPIPYDGAGKRTINKMLYQIRHPYLQSDVQIDFIPDHNLLVLIQPYCPQGSIKDLLHQAPCTDSYNQKYTKKSPGLTAEQTKTFSKQILEALIYLEESGFPQHGHIHSGNVMFNGVYCYLTGLENVFLHLPHKTSMKFVTASDDLKRNLDIVCFGHLIYEMAVGRELSSATPTMKELKSLTYQPLRELIEFIFYNPDYKYPSFKQIKKQNYFQSVSLHEISAYAITKPRLSKEMKKVIKAIKKGKSITELKSQESKSSFPYDQDAGASTVKSSKSTKGKPSASSSLEAKSSPVKPTISTKPPLVDKSSTTPKRIPDPPNIDIAREKIIPPAAVSSERTSLLADIRRGRQLKKTSNPKV